MVRSSSAGLSFEVVNPRHLSLRTKFFLLVAVGSIVTATTAYVLHFRFLENLELQTIDLRFSLRGDQPSPKDVVIVRVDDVTFNELNEQWPFPRSMHGALLAPSGKTSKTRRRKRQRSSRAGKA